MSKRAYKLFRVRKDGTLGSLFINRKEILPLDSWMIAQSYPTKGYKLRPFWHCTAQPVAPHLAMTTAGGEIRQWYEVEMQNWEEFQRPQSQGGVWYLAGKIRVLGPALINACTDKVGC